MKYDVETIKNEMYSGVLCDVMDGMGYRSQSIARTVMPLKDHTVIFGPAFTSIGTQVYSMPADPLTAQCRVVDQLGEGEVYVLVIRGEKNCAVFGELFATAVLGRKGAGVLTDGYARDVKQLHQMDFPLFYGGRDPRTSKGRCEINECQIPVALEGVTIHPGDYIFGDIDGVAVIPAAIVDEVLEKAMETIKKEDTVRDGLKNGASLQEVYSKVGAI